MRTILTIAVVTILGFPSAGLSADREKSQARIDSARSSLNEFKSNAGESKTIDAEVKAAERNLEKASAAQKAGEKMFGGLSDEADADVRHETSLLDLNLKLAASKLEKSKIEAESAVLGKKIDVVQAKVKIFDDFRAEIARLKEEVASTGKAVKEFEKLKGEKISLEEQVAKLSGEMDKLGAATTEISALKVQLTAAIEENRRLKVQQEKLPTESKAVPPAPQKSASEIREADPQVEDMKPAVIEEPQPEVVTAPSPEIEDASPQNIAPADDQNSP
jgi:regulator of replication initiation timing